MTSKEALENITDWIEYFTRLDYVEPEVRGEVKQKFYEAYHKTRPELELIEKDLEKLEYYEKIFKDPLIDIRERLKLLEAFKLIFKKCLVEWHYSEKINADYFRTRSIDYVFERVPNVETYGDILREWVLENDKH